MNKIIEKIRRALEDRKLGPKPMPSAKLVRLEPTKKGVPRPDREFRNRGRGNGARGGRGGGSRGGGDRRVDRDPNSMQCIICSQFGHGWLVCPKGNKEMQKKEVARRAERDNAKEACNVSRALRRTEGKDEEVSEDEEQNEDEIKAGTSVNIDQYSVGASPSLFPHPLAYVRNQQPTNAYYPWTHLIPLAHSAQENSQKSTLTHFLRYHMTPHPLPRLKVTGQ
jgi:hypothetical protein